MLETVTFQLNKIVRNKVLDNMLAIGQKPEYKELSGEELLHELVRKIQEEAGELDAKSSTIHDELIDLQTSLNAVLHVLSINKVDFQRAVSKADEKRGDFSRAYFIGNLTLRADDPWVEYYRKEPERFPEIEKDI